jgi:hypothetical protein
VCAENARRNLLYDIHGKVLASYFLARKFGAKVIQYIKCITTKIRFRCFFQARRRAAVKNACLQNLLFVAVVEFAPALSLKMAAVKNPFLSLSSSPRCDVAPPLVRRTVAQSAPPRTAPQSPAKSAELSPSPRRCRNRPPSKIGFRRCRQACRRLHQKEKGREVGRLGAGGG